MLKQFQMELSKERASPNRVTGGFMKSLCIEPPTRFNRGSTTRLSGGAPEGISGEASKLSKRAIIFAICRGTVGETFRKVPGQTSTRISGRFQRGIPDRYFCKNLRWNPRWNSYRNFQPNC